MKMILLLLTIIIFRVARIKAQQYPHYTQYVLNNYILNPAVSGIENYWDLKLSHRRQWVGVNGAPVTSYLTIHGPLKKDIIPTETATTVKPPGHNPYPRRKVAINPHHGMGLTVINDKLGPFNMFTISASYAYHIPLNSKLNLSAGASVGFQNMSLNTSDLDFGDGTSNDPSITGGGAVNKFNPDLSIGLWLYSARGYFGASVRNLVALPVNYSNGSIESRKLVQHVFITAGRRIRLSKDITVIPSFLIKFVYPAPINFDINAKFQYQNKFWIGTAYRHKDAIAFMAGFNINSTFNFGYSYDYTTSGLNTMSRGTHEILLGILLGNRYKVYIPKFH